MSAVEPVYWDDLEHDGDGRVVCPRCGGVMAEEQACEGATWLECESCGAVEIAVVACPATQTDGR